MKAYILKGDPAEVEKVIRENRIRVNRGVISFTSVGSDAEPGADGFGAFDTKDAPAEDTKQPESPAKKATKTKK